jgi:hypothetical protein
MPKTAGDLDAVAARRGKERGAERARFLNESILRGLCEDEIRIYEWNGEGV